MDDPLIQRRPSMTDGEALKQAIRRRGYTISDFAKVAGVHPQTIRDWASARRATQLRVEWKVRWTLRQLPIMFGDVPGEDPFGDQAVPLPPAAVQALGPGIGILRPPVAESGMRIAQVPRPPRAALLVDSSFDAFRHALEAVPPLQAWKEYGFRLVSSGRAGSTFIRALADHRPWDAFPELGDREVKWPYGTRQVERWANVSGYAVVIVAGMGVRGKGWIMWIVGNTAWPLSVGSLRPLAAPIGA